MKLAEPRPAAAKAAKPGRRLPRHVGVIPDGNRRWAEARGLGRHQGYMSGIEPGLRLYRACRELGVEELSVYGFTKDNVKRPSAQVEAFKEACVQMAESLEAEGAAVLAIGDAESAAFPAGLRRFLRRSGRGLKVNLLVNYGWRWDVQGLAAGRLRSERVPHLDMVVRWGGGRRLSGFLPIQSVYADFFVVDRLWPDFNERDFEQALAWYSYQDRTLGG